MSDINNFVQVTVTRAGATGTVQQFNDIGVVNENTVQNASTRVQIYSSIAEIETAGFVAADFFHKAATAAFDQNPRPQTITSIWKDIDANEATYDIPLTAAEASNDGDFYFIVIDSRADADVLNVAAWVASRRKLQIAQTSSADFRDGVAGNIGEQLRLAARRRSMIIWREDDGEAFDAGIIAIQAAADLDAPDGQITLNLKQVQGFTPDATKLTTTQENNIRADNGNVYTLVGGKARFSDSRMCDSTPGAIGVGGDNFMDLMTSEDWTFFRLQEATFDTLAGSKKIPITNGGIGALAGAAAGVWERGQRNGHYDPEQRVNVISPKVSDISQSDRQKRVLNPPIKLEPRISGAFHQVKVDATLTF